ncbi:S-layer homology domain-containing protein [Paenibacillus sp. GCM10027627]|uniref:S-layer homology domain-containing protein n=1 Tax=unclassified Paenibacillus TaxID=185978 RepID=UPI003644F984
MMKKFIVGITVISMLLASSPVLASAKNQPSDWAKAEVSASIKAGLVPSNLQSDYQKPITRGEFAQLLVQSMFANFKNINSHYKYWTLEDFNKKVEVVTGFTDTDKDYVKVAFALGAINGVSETKFKPNDLITRQEAATMLANTIHMQTGFSYRKNTKEYGYSDFDKIASWAKPAVMLVHSAEIMEGTGGKFDYSGKYTREQSITTLKRIYNRQSISQVAFRGNILSLFASDELSFIVTKNSVKVKFDESSSANNSIVSDFRDEWRTYKETKDQEFSPPKGAIIYGFQQVTESRSTKPLLEKTFAGKSVKIDYGYMVMSTYNKDSLIEFKFKKMAGYASLVAGYTYGFPEVAVTPKEIK